MSGIITIVTFGAIEIMLHVFLVVGVWIVYAKSKMKKPLDCSSLIRPAVKAKKIGIILSLIIATLLGIISCIMILIKNDDVETYLLNANLPDVGRIIALNTMVNLRLAGLLI